MLLLFTILAGTRYFYLSHRGLHIRWGARPDSGQGVAVWDGRRRKGVVQAGSARCGVWEPAGLVSGFSAVSSGQGSGTSLGTSLTLTVSFYTMLTGRWKKGVRLLTIQP